MRGMRRNSAQPFDVAPANSFCRPIWLMVEDATVDRFPFVDPAHYQSPIFTYCCQQVLIIKFSTRLIRPTTMSRSSDCQYT